MASLLSPPCRFTLNPPFAQTGGGAGEGRQEDDVIVQYVVLRRDLIETWPLGSVVTQGCHAFVSALWDHREDPLTFEYCSPEKIDSMHKCLMRADRIFREGWEQIEQRRLQGVGHTNKDQEEKLINFMADKQLSEEIVKLHELQNKGVGPNREHVDGGEEQLNYPVAPKNVVNFMH